MPKTKKWPTGIRPSGKGLQIRIWENRKLVYQETIECEPTNRAAIAAAVKRREFLVARLRAGVGLGEVEPELQVFRDVALDYLETLDARDNTTREYYRILANWWVPELGPIPVQEITAAHIKRILALMPVTSKTKKNRLVPLFGALKHGNIQPPYIRLKKHQKPPVDRYSPAERESLLSILDGQSKAYFTILFSCGLRPGEALALEWCDYDGEQLHIRKSVSKRKVSPVKTAVRRKVYVPTWARPIIGALPSRFAGGYFFLNSMGTVFLDTDTFNTDWRAAHRKARIAYRVPYACRHTRAAELLSVGVLPAKAAKQLGHSTEMFLRIYSEFIEEYAKEDAGLLEGGVGKK